MIYKTVMMLTMILVKIAMVMMTIVIKQIIKLMLIYCRAQVHWYDLFMI